MRKELDNTKKLITYQLKKGMVCNIGIPFDRYQKVYAGTNENIAGMLEKTELEKKNSALTVLASGDHAFHMALHGIKDIDTFDTNKLTEYYALGIKRTAIMKYSYKEYLQFLRIILNPGTPLDILTQIISDLCISMEEPYKSYWESLNNWNYEEQKNSSVKLNLFTMLLLNAEATAKNTITNEYLQSEEKYNQLKAYLKDANISFKECNAIKLQEQFSKQYDIILLSNIPDYFYKTFGMTWSKEEYEAQKESYMKLLNEKGILFYDYLYKYCNEKGVPYRKILVPNSSLRREDIGDDIITFPSVKENEPFTKVKDGAILIKKR